MKKYLVIQVGNVFYVEWTYRKEKYVNGWFLSEAEADCWGARHV